MDYNIKLYKASIFLCNSNNELEKKALFIIATEFIQHLKMNNDFTRFIFRKH
jgi:hypothetical protein